jgi:hypothetical protein
MQTLLSGGNITVWGERLLDDLQPGDTSEVCEVAKGGSFIAINYTLSAEPASIELEFEYSEAGNIWERLAFFNSVTGDSFAFLARPGSYRFRLISKQASGQTITATLTYISGNKLPAEEYVPEQRYSDVVGPNGSKYRIRSMSEEVTLSIVGNVTLSSLYLLPAESIILAVLARITQEINNIAGWEVGDGVMTNRFITQKLQYDEGVTAVGINHWIDEAADIAQVTAAPLKISTVAPQNTTGKIRFVVFYLQFIPPTS